MNPKPEDLEKIVSEAAEADVAPAITPTPAKEADLPDLGLDLEEHRLAFEIDCLQQDLQALKDTYGLRVSYTGRIFWLVVAWLACVVTCVVFSGFKFRSFQLSDNVLIAFITSTTVNVVGLFVLVAKWMFPSGKTSPDGKELHSRSAALRSSRKKTSMSKEDY